MADIARAAGIKRTLLYHYFQHKDEILLQLLLDALDLVELLLVRVRRDSSTPSEQVRQLIDGYFELMEAQPGLAQLLVDSGVLRQGPFLPAYHARIASLRVALIEWAESVSTSRSGGDYSAQFLLVALGSLFIWFLPTPFAEALAPPTPQSAEQYKQVLHRMLAAWTEPC